MTGGFMLLAETEHTMLLVSRPLVLDQPGVLDIYFLMLLLRLLRPMMHMMVYQIMFGEIFFYTWNVEDFA